VMRFIAFYLEKKTRCYLYNFKPHINLGSYLKQWGSQKDIFTVGEKVHYGCEEGFALQGNFNRTCLKNGSWSDEAPICQYYDCSDQIYSGIIISR
jgi:hypothetical protein